MKLTGLRPLFTATSNLETSKYSEGEISTPQELPTLDIIVLLPQTPPWHAPEHHHRGSPLSAAKEADVYTLGLVTLWIKFFASRTDNAVDDQPQVEPNERLRGVADCARVHELKSQS